MASEDRILIVDDELVIRELMTDILREEGFTVDAAPNGMSALEMLRKNKDIVVLFTDIMMPKMDGIELIREARKVSPNLVPIVMTGYATLDTARAAVKEGAYDYVLKPFNLSEVKMAVTNALERCRLTNENARLREVTGLFNISESIAQFRTESSLFEYVLNAAIERTEATRGSVMLVSDDAKSLEIACSVGLPPEAGRAVAGADESISGWVARNMQPLLVPNIDDAPDLNQRSRTPGNGSFVSAPLLRNSGAIDDPLAGETEAPQVIAVLNVTHKRDGRSFSESDLKILNIIATHAAAALENVRLIRGIEEAQREIVFTLGEIVETRSRETGNHVKRVAEYCKILGVAAGLTPTQAEVLRMASPLHDVGKVGIPDAILNKPGKLTPDEFDVIKTHATLGYDMLKISKGRVLQAAAIIALQHHEKYAGGGYPQGLAGKDIHLFGRIAGIADVFDALGVKRVYKEAWELGRILDLFRKERGNHFDPDLIDVFFAHLDEILSIRDAFPESEGDLHD